MTINSDAISDATNTLHSGGVIAYPTEAVWGLGCDPYDEEAVHKILSLKEREVEKGLIIVASGMEQLSSLLTPLAQEKIDLLSETWPGPVTWLIPDEENLYPSWVKGQFSSVAVRVSAHPLVAALCEKFGKPIISTSANKAGEPEIRSRLRIDEVFSDKLDYILDGELGDSDQPSQIRDLVSGTSIR